MADEYTPTTDEVREVWVQEQDITHGEGADFHAAEFDRWLAAHEAEVRERIAQDIEADAMHCAPSDHGCFACTNAARIARGATR